MAWNRRLIRKACRACVAILMALLAVLSAHAEPLLQVYTEEFPPYSFSDDEGRLTGVSTRVVEAVLKLAGFEYRLISQPWARTFIEAQSGENRLIYSISRRREREPLFQWVGVVAPSSQSVFSLRGRDDIQLRELNDMKRYRIGTMISDARESWLLQQGFAETDFQRLSGDKALLRNYQLLRRGRIDLWPVPDAVAWYVVKRSGDDPQQVLYKRWEFTELSRGGYYLAASIDTPAAVVDRLRLALGQFKRTEQYRQLLQTWGLNSPLRD